MIGLRVLEMVKVFGKNETAIRMSLSRAVKAGVLINSKQDNEVYYTLTYQGKKAISLWNEGAINFWKRYRLRNSGWDNKWHFINVDFLEGKKDVKAEFLDKLGQYGYAQINTNTWITPFLQDKEVLGLIKEYGMGDAVVEIHGEMKIHKDMSRFLDEIFGIGKLKIKYRGFTGAYEGKLAKISKVYKDKDFIDNGLALPFLQELGWSFFNIASEDSVLPKEVLPVWEGDKAAYIMKESRKMLVEAANKYFERYE
jgi:DNA-binding transcriptional regulator PaaX